MGTGKALANFDYSAPLNETVLLGVVGGRFPGKKLLWDRDQMKFTNEPAANAFVQAEYRKF